MNKPKAETKEMFKIIIVVRLKALGVATRVRLRESPVQSSIFSSCEFHLHGTFLFNFASAESDPEIHACMTIFLKKEIQLVDG